jgi:hypothetical protein
MGSGSSDSSEVMDMSAVISEMMGTSNARSGGMAMNPKDLSAWLTEPGWDLGEAGYGWSRGGISVYRC